MIEYGYTITQWVLFFFCYAFIGWIWECFYVSVKGAWENKKWKFVNRGFLYGPIIPIYGFAAISILLATIPFSEDIHVVFIIGALTASLFELITGTAMERLFKVKYWDYSDLPLNYNGYICFFVSLFWGFFSVLLVQFVHVPVAAFMLKIPQAICEILAVAAVIIFSCDATVSFNDAMELRDILKTLFASNETLRRLECRFDVMVAFTPIPDKEDWQDIKDSARKKVIYNAERLRCKNEERINEMKELILLPKFNELQDRAEILESLEIHRKQLMQKSNKQFMSAMSHLKRNPMIKSEKYQEIIELLNNWSKK